MKPLIFEGCRRARRATDFGHPFPNQFNICLMLSIVLLAGCGIRKSELFHIFADDVRLDEVRLYHPEMGLAAWKTQDATLRRGSRQEYLAAKFNLRPRSLLPKGHGNFSGWKNLLLDYGSPENYARLYWISDGLKKLFYRLHTIYITHLRPVGLCHPYYFICQDHKNFGEPWTISAFDDAFDDALCKIKEKRSRERGTNPHGLRHLYGQTLTDLGVRPIVIQHAMHHHSIESQMVYTRPSPEKITRALNAVAGFESGKPPESLTNEFEPYDWACDPLKLFAPWNLGAL
ncbi:tyrosine-type recombinase/integrase [Microvirga massiliensis]|uniref:tyrosine-type recombinase/integrase n=1 Tax=Microvirga massiliensis TaxID=1033741 RepID=UPI00164E915C|nr:tyrosine-type recombinase/integrase [Microvirga massiliensis]